MSCSPAIRALAEPGKFLYGLRIQSLMRLEEAAKVQAIPAGGILIGQGDTPALLRVVVSGCLKITHLTSNGTRICLGFAGPGDPVSWPAALQPNGHATSAKAATDTLVMECAGAVFDSISVDDPVLLRNAFRAVSERSDLLLTQLSEFVTEPVEQRLARALLRIAGRDPDGTHLQTPPISRQDLAELTGTTHFTVSRILKAWDAQGLITNRRPRIVISDPSCLRARADGTREAIRRRRLPRSPAGRADERHLGR